MLNNDYVTPQVVRDATAPFVDGNRYFTDGDDRPPFYGAWQPRVGLSYDLTGHGKHVLFGGYGLYYDRVIYNAGLDERFRLQYAVRSFQFSADGAPRNGQATIVWDPAYQSRAGLDGLIAAGIAPAPEVFLIANDTRPPVTDQFNGGIRTSIGGVLLSANYAGIRGRNGLTFVFGNRRADGTCCQSIPGFSNILTSDDGKKNWFDALYLTADRPFDSRWGMRVVYTLGKAEAIGGDLFSLDYRRVEDYPRHPVVHRRAAPRDRQRHRRSPVATSSPAHSSRSRPALATRSTTVRAAQASTSARSVPVRRTPARARSITRASISGSKRSSGSPRNSRRRSRSKASTSSTRRTLVVTTGPSRSRRTSIRTSACRRARSTTAVVDSSSAFGIRSNR